jgi:DNA-binding GntR family transcriptional regulator
VSAAASLPRRLSARSPKGEQLREILEGLIGALGPGAPLPSERVLAERYAVARMTVRSEIDRLAAEGLVYRLQGRGTFVGEPRVTQAMTLTSFSEDMRARGMAPGSRVLAQDVVGAGEAIAGRLGIAIGTPVIRIGRVRTADGEPMAVEEAYLPAERFAGLETTDLEQSSLFDVMEERFPMRIASADQRAIAVAIDQPEADLLGVAAGEPGLQFRTIARDATDEAVFYATSLYRGDRYEIRLRQERR